MATDQKISQLTENPSITGTEELATERGGSNYKNTFNSLKTWILTGLSIGVETITGDMVNNTDPLNPVLSFPNTGEVAVVTDKNYVTDLEKNVLTNTSNTNTGDETTSTIQSKRPLKTVGGETLEGTGNVEIPDSGVQGVTGDGVDNTDPLNPVLSFPNADEVDDTSTSNKFATQTELDQIGTNTTDIAGKQNEIVAGDIVDYYRGDKTFQVLNKSTIGLGNVDNTSDLAKPISTATQTALDGKVGSTTVGEPSGSDVVGNMVSLTQAEYDAGTPVSTTFYIVTDA